jgi:hypothetical protein
VILNQAMIPAVLGEAVDRKLANRRSWDVYRGATVVLRDLNVEKE